MSAPDPGFWADIAKWLWGLLVPAGWWMWKKQDDRIEKLENARAYAVDVKELKEAVQSVKDKMVTSDQLAAHEASDRDDRAERRETEISLFNKVDELKDSMSQRLDALKDLIMRIQR